MLRTEFDGGNNFLDLTGDKSKFINKQIILWSTKKGQKLSATLAGIHPRHTRFPLPPKPGHRKHSF